MSQNPYQPNVGGPTHRVATGNPTSVKAPAIALIVVGALDVLYGLFSVVKNIVAPTNEVPANLANDPAMAEFAAFMSDNTPMINVAVGGGQILLSALLIFGAVKMLSRSSYGLAMMATIIAMVPCTGAMDCCLVEIGIGIWSLVILLQATTKPMFR